MLRATANPHLLLHRHNVLQGRVREHGLFFAYQQLLDQGFFKEFERQAFFGTIRGGKPATAWDTIVRYVTDATTHIVIDKLMAIREDARDRTGRQEAAENAKMTLRAFSNLHRQSINTQPSKIRDNRIVKGYAPLGLVLVRQANPHDEYEIKPGLVSVLFYEKVFIPAVRKWAPTLEVRVPASAA